jgi:hemerythrin-like domain-containing protein
MQLPGSDQMAVKIAQASEANDPTAILLAEHEWLRGLLDEYHAPVSRGERLGEIHEAIEALKPHLDLHIRREEEVYFPAVEAFVLASGRGSTVDMYGEHDAIRIRLDELMVALNRQTNEGQAYGAFSRSLLAHFDNEEELVFVDAPDQLSQEARSEILKQFSALVD